MQLPGSVGGLGLLSEVYDLRDRHVGLARVRALARAGWSAPVIAARVGTAVGQVRAVLDADPGDAR